MSLHDRMTELLDAVGTDVPELAAEYGIPVEEFAAMVEETRRTPEEADRAKLAYLSGLLHSRVGGWKHGVENDDERRAARVALAAFEIELAEFGIRSPLGREG